MIEELSIKQLKYNTTIKDLLNELSKISGMSVED